MYSNPPNTSDVPHDRCPSSSKSLSAIPANTPTHDIPYVVSMLVCLTGNLGLSDASLSHRTLLLLRTVVVAYPLRM